METRGRASGTVRGHDGETYEYNVSWELRGDVITWDAVSRLAGTERTRRAHLAGVLRYSPQDDLEWYVKSAVSADVAAGKGKPM